MFSHRNCAQIDYEITLIFFRKKAFFPSTSLSGMTRNMYNNIVILYNTCNKLLIILHIISIYRYFFLNNKHIITVQREISL